MTRARLAALLLTVGLLGSGCVGLPEDGPVVETGSRADVQG